MHFDVNCIKSTASGASKICIIPDVQIVTCYKLQEKEIGAVAVTVPMPPGLPLLFLVAFSAFIHLLPSPLSQSTEDKTVGKGELADQGVSSPQRVTLSTILSGPKAILR